MQSQFATWSYIIFIAVGLILYWLAVPRRFRPHLLLLLSLGYYAMACLNDLDLPIVIKLLPFFFLIFYLYAMFAIGVMIDTAASTRGRKVWLFVGLLCALGVLLIFKSSSSLITVSSRLFGVQGGRAAAIIFTKFGIPLGISYFSFRVVHYLVEVYRGKEKRASALEFFLYVAYFPTVISGPIHRFFTVRRENPAESFGVQLRQASGGPGFSAEDFRQGAYRIITGIIKKFVIADLFFRLAEPVMKSGLLLTSPLWQIWLAGHAYFLYLYIEFSGYSDIAIGVSRLFGYRVMENFSWPLLAPNLQEFWRRWHMSLTSWLTNYVYIPLGGGRRSRVRVDLNILITIIAVALWHEISIAKFFWGLFEGLALVIFLYWRRFRRRVAPNRKPTWWGKAIGVIMVWHVHCLLWPLFLHKWQVTTVFYLKAIKSLF